MSWPSLLAIFILVAAPLALFAPALFAHRVIRGFDLVALIYPFWTEVRSGLAAQHLPLWMPGILGGMPGIAACEINFLYPSDLIASLAGWSFPTQFGVDAALHVALSGIGMFLFLRRLRRSRSAALLGAFFFAFSGSQISPLWGGFYTYVEGIALVPWAFWAAHWACQEESWFAWGLCGLVFSLQILAGATQPFTYTAMAVAAFALSMAWREGTGVPAGNGKIRLAVLGSSAAGLALALGLTVLLAAPQLWTTLQYLPLTLRQAYTYPQFIAGSIGLSEAVTWLVPGFYGWQEPTYHGAMTLCFTSEYFGLLPWALAAAALAALWRREAWVRWMAGLALAAFILGQRHWTPFLAVFHHLPVFSSFRWWYRILFLLTFAVCVLAAYGWDALGDEARRSKAARGVGFFIALALAVCALSYAVAGISAASAQGMPWFSDPALYPHGAEGLTGTLTAIARTSARTSLVLLLGLAGLLRFSLGRWAARAALLVALLFHGVESWPMLSRYVHYLDPSLLVASPHFSQSPPAPPGVEPWRVFDYDKYYPNNDLILGYENLCGYESLPMKSAADIESAMFHRRQEWLNLMNVRYLFIHSQGGAYAPGDKVSIFENHAAFPRAWLVERSRVVAGDQEAYRLLADPAFDPRVEVALPSDPGLVPGRGRAELTDGFVHWLGRDSQTCSLDVSTGQRAVLVLSNAWYPDWRCSVDGNAAAVLKADGGLQAVVLDSGRHRVDFRFDGGLFYDALAACLAGLAALLGLAFWV